VPLVEDFDAEEKYKKTVACLATGAADFVCVVPGLDAWATRSIERGISGCLKNPDLGSLACT